MKKLLLAVVLLACLNMLYATADGPDNWRVKGVASNDTLNIRSQPNYKSKKVGKIPYNATCLKNLDCIVNKSRWCKIEYKGTIGWVSGRFLSEPGYCPSQKLSPIPVSVKIKKIKSADIMDDGEMLCKFQAATDELPPITDCFDSSSQKWIDVRDKNIQGNFTTLRNSGEAQIVIKNNRVVDFVEILDPAGY